jgi:hypothetical protein
MGGRLPALSAVTLNSARIASWLAVTKRESHAGSAGRD